MHLVSVSCRTREAACPATLRQLFDSQLHAAPLLRVLQCKKIWATDHTSVGCGPECLNRMLNIECVEVRACRLCSSPCQAAVACCSAVQLCSALPRAHFSVAV